MVLVCLPVVATLGAVMGWAGLVLFAEAGGWWRGLSLMAGAAFMLFVVVLLLNNLFSLRLEIDAEGLRMNGNPPRPSQACRRVAFLYRLRLDAKGQPFDTFRANG